MFPTDTDHCPTCGTDVDARALDMMVRNRQARDAQLQDFVTELHRRDAEDRKSWNRFTFGSQVAFALVVIAYVVWSSAQILHLKGVLH